MSTSILDHRIEIQFWVSLSRWERRLLLTGVTHTVAPGFISRWREVPRGTFTETCLNQSKAIAGWRIARAWRGAVIVGMRMRFAPARAIAT